MQMVWETWFKSSWTHFLFAAGFARAFTMEVGIVQEEEKHLQTYVCGTPLYSPQNLGMADTDARDPWRGFKGGDGVVRSKRITRTAGKVPGEHKGQELDSEALLNPRPFQPGCE